MPGHEMTQERLVLTVWVEEWAVVYPGSRDQWILSVTKTTCSWQRPEEWSQLGRITVSQCFVPIPGNISISNTHSFLYLSSHEDPHPSSPPVIQPAASPSKVNKGDTFPWDLRPPWHKTLWTGSLLGGSMSRELSQAFFLGYKIEQGSFLPFFLTFLYIQRLWYILSPLIFFRFVIFNYPLLTSFQINEMSLRCFKFSHSRACQDCFGL